MNFAQLRAQMVTEQLIPRGISDRKLLAAMGKVPRELFLPDSLKKEAYTDFALPIGYAQTISQPYMVAEMIQLLRLTGTEKVLEIGSGSGYQAAVLAELASEVYTVERITELAEFAQNNLNQAGYQNVKVVAGDGTKGLAAQAPFEAIIVAAATDRIPKALKEQLKNGGRLVIPVGDSFGQVVTVLTRTNDNYSAEYFDRCIFVPLISSKE